MEEKRYQLKLQIAEAFAELVEEMPHEHITVNMIVERINKHRKTFYYHFTDKGQLIVWLFRYDLACALEERYESSMLVYERDDKEGGYPDFPYYARKFNERGHIYNPLFFSTLAQCLETRREYYRIILSYCGPGSLDFYLQQLYVDAIYEDILILIENEIEGFDKLSISRVRNELERSDALNFLAEFYTGAFLSRIVDRLHYSPERRTAREILPYENVVHDSITMLVHKYALETLDTEFQ